LQAVRYSVLGFQQAAGAKMPAGIHSGSELPFPFLLTTHGIRQEELLNVFLQRMGARIAAARAIFLTYRNGRETHHHKKKCEVTDGGGRRRHVVTFFGEQLMKGLDMLNILH
jgi:hypothetical protein